MTSRANKVTLAEKINSLISAAPTNFESDTEAEETKAKVVEHYEENDSSDEGIEQSKIRKQNVPLLEEVDKRYEGRKVSRREIYSEDNNSDASESMDAAASEEEKSKSDIEDEDLGSTVDDEEYRSNENEETENDDISSDDAEYDLDRSNPLYRNRQSESNFKTMSATNLGAEIEKGNCVRSQLKIWENLLEIRIKLQKCLVNGNQIPQYDTHKEFRVDEGFMKTTNETKNKLTLLLDNMLNLQNVLLKQFPDTKELSTKGKKRKLDEQDGDDSEDSMNEDIPSDTEDEVETKEEETKDVDSQETEGQVPTKKLKFSDYETILEERHKLYKDYRNSVINKWNDRTRVASGNLNKGGSETTLKQIEFALNDKVKLRKRTQLKRSEYKIMGKPLPEEDADGRRVQEFDPEIYDDDDFYHQLLRDLIQFKSADVTDPIQLSKQWIKLQNMRSKMKRKIDTRATKGRRIRYNVHNKLVNFMAPVTVYDTWTDLAKNELYNSLFGKIKSVEEIKH